MLTSKDEVCDSKDLTAYHEPAERLTDNAETQRDDKQKEEGAGIATSIQDSDCSKSEFSSVPQPLPAYQQ